MRAVPVGARLRRARLGAGPPARRRVQKTSVTYGSATRSRPRVAGSVASRQRTAAATRRRAAGGAAATALIESARSTNRSGGPTWTNRNARRRSGAKPLAAAANGLRHPAARAVGVPRRYGSVSRENSATQATVSSRVFQTRASPPPGRSTRAISRRAARGRNQWNACAQTTASANPSGSGIASAVPSSATTDGSFRANSRRIAAVGSTPTSAAPSVRRARVNFPVPLARSTTVVPGPSRRVRPRYRTAAAG